MASPLLAQEKPERRMRLPEELTEVSGLYYAGPDSLWWHNDGGNAPVLYLTDGKGRIKQQVLLPGLKNIDWEDLTADDQGNLYIGDFGDNLGRRQELHIYRYRPATGELDSIAFQLRDEERSADGIFSGFDTEAFFWHNDSLHLFTKSKLPKSSFFTKHYVLADRGAVQLPELRDSLRLKRRVVTGAAIDTASGTVALVAYYYRKLLGFIPYSAASVFLFRNFPDGRFLQGDCRRKRISCILATQYESVDFIDEKYLYVASEKTLFIRPKAKRVKWRPRASRGEMP